MHIALHSKNCVQGCSSNAQLNQLFWCTWSNSISCFGAPGPTQSADWCPTHLRQLTGALHISDTVCLVSVNCLLRLQCGQSVSQRFVAARWANHQTLVSWSVRPMGQPPKISQLISAPGGPTALTQSAHRAWSSFLFWFVCCWRFMYRARTFKLLISPGTGFKEPIPAAYVSWRAGTIDCLKIPTPICEVSMREQQRRSPFFVGIDCDNNHGGCRWGEHRRQRRDGLQIFFY
jgi:hypothetical protein